MGSSLASSCTSPSPSPLLPPELHAQVAAHVARGDLCRFALCCRSFATCARAELYRHLLLQTRTPRPRALQILGAASLPHNARHVKALAVDWDMLDDAGAREVVELAVTTLRGTHNLAFLALSARAVATLAPDTHLPALRRLQCAALPPRAFLRAHADQLTHLALLPPPEHDEFALPPMPALHDLTTTAALAESLLAHGPAGQRLARLTVHARERAIAFPSAPFFALLARACPSLATLWLVDWRPPAEDDDAPVAATLPRVTALGVHLTYCYCVADMACPQGAYVWERFLAAAARVLPAVETLEFPCGAGAEDEEHVRPACPPRVWDAPVAYTRHMRALRRVNLGSGLAYARRAADGAFVLDQSAERLETPYLCLPRDLREYADDVQ